MHNPFAALAAAIPPIAMQIYVVVMFLLVIFGTLIDLAHKGSAKYFFKHRQIASFAATRAVGAGEAAGFAAKTIVVTVLAAGEFCGIWRRLTHILTMYGFLLYVVTTAVMVFAYPTAAAAGPAIVAELWYLGAVLVCVGGYWYWLLQRVDVAAEGHSPLRLVRADLFIVSLLASATFALIWAHFQDDGRIRPGPASSSALSSRQHRALCVRPVVQVRPHVLQARRGVSEAHRAGERLPPQPARAGRPTRDVRQRPPSAAQLLRSIIHAHFCLHDELRRLRILRRYLPVGHHAHRSHVPPCVQHRAQHVLGMLFVREGMPAACHRLPRLCRFRALGHSVRVLREEEKATVSWRIKFRDGREKNFVSPIRTTPWGSIKGPIRLCGAERGGA